MAHTRSARELLKWIASMSAVVLGLYVGTYYVTARRGIPWGASFRPLVTPVAYRVPSSLHGMAKTMFAPIHRLDRHMRPGFWAPEPWKPSGETRW